MCSQDPPLKQAHVFEFLINAPLYVGVSGANRPPLFIFSMAALIKLDIVSYVTVAATLKTDKKTSSVVDVIS